MNQGKGGGGQDFLFLSLSRGLFHEFRGVPFREKHLVSFKFQPTFEEPDLGGFARSIQTFDGDQPSRDVPLFDLCMIHLFIPSTLDGEFHMKTWLKRSHLRMSDHFSSKRSPPPRKRRVKRFPEVSALKEFTFPACS